MIESKLIYKNTLDKKHIEEIIKEELGKLNYNFKYIGTEYLVEVIYFLYSTKEYFRFSLEADIYPIIANKYGCSCKTVKSNIVNATDKMFYDCNESILKRYIGKYKTEKPGPKAIIKSVLKRIKDI